MYTKHILEYIPILEYMRIYLYWFAVSVSYQIFMESIYIYLMFNCIWYVRLFSDTFRAFSAASLFSGQEALVVVRLVDAKGVSTRLCDVSQRRSLRKGW